LRIMGRLGMNEVPKAPDTYGLPEYKISEIMTEIDGPDVRILCGVRKFGEVHWLYSCVVRADTLLALNNQTRQAAEEAYNINQMMIRAGH
jgi:hypothetical protein